MANVPIVTEVTLSQLNVLIAANGLNEGLQYKVTDKDWLLIATGDNTLIPVDGELAINNGETIPTGITTNVLKVDSGLITDDYSVNYLQIAIPSLYFPTSVKLTNNTDGSIPMTATQDIDLFTDVYFPPSSTCLYSSFLPAIGGNVSIKGFNTFETLGLRAIFKCEL